MKFFIILFLYSSLYAVSASSYTGFLDYDHNGINRIRSITFEPNKFSNLQPIEIDGRRMGCIGQDGNRVIIALTETGPLARTPRHVFTLGNINGEVDECYEGVIKKLTKIINLENYSQREVIVSGNRLCSKLALLFAASQLSFAEPHQHKVVLFGIPTFSDTSLYASIAKKIRYKNDILVFDYYSLIPKSVSLYPGLLIEMTPRNFIKDAWNSPLTRYSMVFKMLGGVGVLSTGGRIAFNGARIIFNNGRVNLSLIASTVSNPSFYPLIPPLTCMSIYYLGNKLENKDCIPSQDSVQEAFLRFREAYHLSEYTPLENIGTLRWIQASRL